MEVECSPSGSSGDLSMRKEDWMIEAAVGTALKIFPTAKARTECRLEAIVVVEALRWVGGGGRSLDRPGRMRSIGWFAPHADEKSAVYVLGRMARKLAGKRQGRATGPKDRQCSEVLEGAGCNESQTETCE